MGPGFRRDAAGLKDLARLDHCASAVFKYHSLRDAPRGERS